MPHLRGRCLIVGSWGVKANESDIGLDYLGLVHAAILKPNDYKQFDVVAVLEYLKSHIIKVIRHDWKPLTKEEIKQYKKSNLPIPKVLSEEEIQAYVDEGFRVHYSYVVTLVAECLCDYFQTGEYIIYDYEASTERKITKFVYTTETLEFLLSELENFLEPTHFEYESWASGESLQEWLSHILMLCNSMKGGLANGYE